MTEKYKSRGIVHNKIFLPTFRIEADGRTPFCRLAISGVKSVAIFSEIEIEFVTAREFIKIHGKSLKISVFEAECAEISGEVISVHFRDKRRKNDVVD